ncbi:FAD-dependent oxidoreductase domain-containing protein 1-like [Asterias amurensis]|uniref:FAD-dependent oxidoreductase domain-containing protein 1-like n=1 Tax=Asterias amurensis TaxID=7602 RepID=UPI003AB37DF2
MASQLVYHKLHQVFSCAFCFTKHRPWYGCLQRANGKYNQAAMVTRGISSALGLNRQPITPEQVPSEADVVVVGSGIVGTSLAYFLGSMNAARRTPGQPPLRVLVIQGDDNFAETASFSSFGGIRQQFLTPENILMPLFTSNFVKNAQKYLHVEGEDVPDVEWREQGYLFLTSDPTIAEKMVTGNKLQRELGAHTELLTPDMIKERYPWVHTDDVLLGSFGSKNEGWLNSTKMLAALRLKSQSQGCRFIHGRVTGFGIQGINGDSNLDYDCETADRRVQSVQVKLADSTKNETVEIRSSAVVLAAGAASKALARLMGVGEGPVGSLLHYPIPSEAVVRHAFIVHIPGGLGPVDTLPFFVDIKGTYFRPDSQLHDHFVICRGPKEGVVQAWNEVDYDLYNDAIFPELSHRIPKMKKMKVMKGFSGAFDANSYDSNSIIGGHPAFTNLYMATAFGGHGTMQSAAVARGLSELILFGGYRTLDLSRFGFERCMAVQEHSIESELNFC